MRPVIPLLFAAFFWLDFRRPAAQALTNEAADVEDELQNLHCRQEREPQPQAKLTSQIGEQARPLTRREEKKRNEDDNYTD